MFRLHLIAALTVGVVALRWLYAVHLFGPSLMLASRAMYRQAMHSVRKFYLVSCIFGILSAPLSAIFDLAPPGMPLLSFMYGLFGLGILGLPPAFLIVGSSRPDTYALMTVLNS